MSYGEYGGLGYRDGALVESASDAVITPEMENVGTHGSWTDRSGRPDAVYGHVVVGDGPVLVALHKQSYLSIHLLADGAFAEIEPTSVAVDLPDELVGDHGDGELVLDAHALASHGRPIRMELEGHAIEYLVRHEPRMVQHVRLVQPDGTVWTAFSGAEIGAGHDEDDTRAAAARHAGAFA
jgi:hypothetical protein